MSNSSSEYNDDINHLLVKSNEINSYNTFYTASGISNRVIIFPPTIDWNWMKQRPQQLMEQFSLHGFEVYYCNKTQSESELYTTINLNLTIIHNNNYLIKIIVPKLKSQGKKIILWVSWSKLYSSLDEYLPNFIIYDYLDDFSEWKQYLKPMVDKSNIVIASSTRLLAQMEEEFPHKPSYLVPNGCHLNHFKSCGKIETPYEFTTHKGPIITYSGAWARWIDHELVNKIALTFKNALVAIIGIEFDSFVDRNIPNLRYLGYKPYNELPNYLHYSSVCIIPFLLNQITIATNPIKMYEYLASGKPVVSTDIPEARYIPSVHIGVDHDSFIEKVKLILDNKIVFCEEEVYNWLASHTWGKRFDAILTILNEFAF